MNHDYKTVCVRIPESWDKVLKGNVKRINERGTGSMSSEQYLYRVIAAEVAKIKSMEAV